MHKQIFIFFWVTNIPANVNRNRLLWPLSKSSAISPLLRKQQTSIKSARGLTSFHWDRASWADNTSLAFVLSSVIPRCMQQLFLCLLWNRAFYIKGEKRLWKIAGIFISFRFAKKKRLWNIPVPLVSDIPKKNERETRVPDVRSVLPLVLFRPVRCQGDEFSRKWTRFSNKVGQKS